MQATVQWLPFPVLPPQFLFQLHSVKFWPSDEANNLLSFIGFYPAGAVTRYTSLGPTPAMLLTAA